MAQKGDKTEEKSNLAKIEEDILDFWSKESIFEKSLKKNSPKGKFIFYEGPPTANGRPGIHHLLSRAFKDVILRYKTMQGYHVRRRAGWDTHGLPVELEVEKTLGLKSKKEIEEYGVSEFNEKCKESVWKYIEEWEKFTDRMGYWLDQKDAYITYKPGYIESIWNIVKEISNKGLLYKDYKVVPWCPRCGTALSSHELAQGYKDVKDLSITAEFRIVGKENTSLLAWTTTPWTLPGNIALAVNPEINYVEIEKKDEGDGEPVRFILAKDRLAEVFSHDKYEVKREIKGKELVGLEYEPLFPYLKEIIAKEEKEGLAKAFRIYPAEFVTTEDGTGIVHTSVMYGQDDFELGTEFGLPKHHLVGEDGKFLPGTGSLEGVFVKDEKTDVAIIKDLHSRGLLFEKAKYEHSYPHCWRCKTPLIYYARDSWYIKMSDLRDELVSENEKINWEPDYFKEGRFGEWLREIKDWAISRERYWGTPLPIWENEDGKDRIIPGSVDEIKKLAKSSKNKYFVIRHGEAESNATNTISCGKDSKHKLTEKGIKEVEKSAENLKSKKIDVITASPILRTKQTAKIIAEALGIKENEIVFDDDIQEIYTGVFNGELVSEYRKAFPSLEMKYNQRPEGGECVLDVKKRVSKFMKNLEAKYQGKTILIVTHEYVAWVLNAIAEGADKNATIKLKQEDDFILTGEVRELKYQNIPRNNDGELDLHKPFVDDVVLVKDGKEYKRVKEVMDVWFDSGAMPFAEDHYPFENKEWIDGEGYPADYITEAIDQTRGWFYTLHAIGCLSGKGLAYKNVICLGHIMDEEGKKMSKSIGNVIDPWQAMDKYGADVLRFWMYSINQPGESKNFDERTIDDVVKKVFNLLLNVHAFYDLHADKNAEYKVSENILDKWILLKTNALVRDVTKSLDNYKVLEAARMIRDFIADLSQWYIRRSRERFKNGGEERAVASATTRKVIIVLSKLLAPFSPFTAEHIFSQTHGTDGGASVHLESWPEVDVTSVEDVVLVENMELLRSAASGGLLARSKAGQKVRQPLQSVTLKSIVLKGKDELLEILKDELNVKEIKFDEKIAEDVIIDTELTHELIQEGDLREFIRSVQDLRKEMSLNPEQKIKLLWSGWESFGKTLSDNKKMIFETLSLLSLEKTDKNLQRKVKLSEGEISLGAD